MRQEGELETDKNPNCVDDNLLSIEQSNNEQAKNTISKIYIFEVFSISFSLFVQQETAKTVKQQ